jgi:hypothetical protein
LTGRRSSRPLLKAGRKKIKEDIMLGRRLGTAGLALCLVLGLAAGVQARVTEKVDAMIAENTPLKVKDNDLWLQAGGPLVFGVQYDKYATGNIALGLGAGSYLEGMSLDLSCKYYFLTGKFSPFIALGPVLYYSRPKQNIFAVDGVVGLSYFFDEGLGLSLGFAYVKGLTKSEEPFSTTWINDSLAWPTFQFGLHWNY